MSAQSIEHEIAPELQRELQRFPGKWVAMNATEILAVGESVGEVRQAAEQRGETVPTLYRVPAEDPPLLLGAGDPLLTRYLLARDLRSGVDGVRDGADLQCVWRC